MQRQREADKWRGFRLPELFAPIGHLCGDANVRQKAFPYIFHVVNERRIL